MEDNPNNQCDDFAICMFYLGDHPIVCKECKTLNNPDNTICVNCNKKMKK